MLFSLAGLGAGMLLARALGDRLRHTPRPAPPLPPVLRPETAGIGRRTAAAALAAICVALFAGHAFFPGPVLGHVVTAALVVGACLAFGPAHVTLVAIPLIPGINYVYNGLLGQHVFAYYYLSDTLVLTLGAWVLIDRARRNEPLLPRLASTPLVAGFALFGAAAVAWSLRDGAMSFPKLKQLLCVIEGLVVYVVVLGTLRTKTHLRRAGWVLIATVGVMCAVGVIECFARDDYIFQEHPGSAYGQAEKLVVYATMIGPIAFAATLLAGGRKRLLYGLVSLLLLAIIAVTGSRSGWAGGAVVVAATVVLALWRRDWTLGVAAATAIVLLGLLGASVLDVADDRPGAYRTRVMSEVLSLGPTRAVITFARARGEIHRQGLAVIRTRPLLGAAGTEVNRTSTYLNLAVDNGVISAALFLVLVGSVMARNLRLSARVDDPLLSAIALGAAVGLMGMLVTGVGIGWAVRRRFVPLLWYVIALGPAVFAACGEPATDDAALRQARRTAYASALLIALGGLLAVAIALAVQSFATSR
jgi:hypothetical protein